MTRLRVWAPFAKNVQLKVQPQGQVFDLMADEQGFFVSPELQLSGDERYGWVLDGQGPFPDPRSRFQPEGVHGLSAWVPLDDFVWSDQDYDPPAWHNAILYELHVGTFDPRGTFDSVIDHLDHLQSLGISHLELMPVAQFPGQRGWGYDGVQLFAPHSAYGGPDGLRRLVDACHARGLGVVLDVVYNHLGPNGNYLGKFGPYFTDKYKTPWGQAVNFDGPGSDEVRRFFCDNALYWLEHYHLDGLRLDATHAIYDQSARPILAQIAQEVEALGERLGRALVLIAEDCQNDSKVVRARDRFGCGLSSQWNEDFHHALHAAATGESAGYFGDYRGWEDVARTLGEGFVYQGQYMSYRSRSFGGTSAGLRWSQLVNYIQNHDQVGNRPDGARLNHLLPFPLVKVLAALLILGPGVPMIFMGEEWGACSPFFYFVDHDDESLHRAIVRGRRREFRHFAWSMQISAPDPETREAFTNSRLAWNELEQGQAAELLRWYQSLVRLRRACPSTGELEVGACTKSWSIDYDVQKQRFDLRRGSLRLVASLQGGSATAAESEGLLLDSRSFGESEAVEAPRVEIFDASFPPLELKAPLGQSDRHSSPQKKSLSVGDRLSSSK